MSELIKVPGIGGEGEVIEILVQVGDKVEVEQGLVTLESDKASMEVPSPKAGVIKSIKVKLGDTLNEGDDLVELELEGGEQAASEEPAEQDKSEQAPKQEAAPAPAEKPAPKKTGGSVQSFNIPDIGDGGARVIELLVQVGDKVEAEQSLLTLESDKASMEIPAPAAGVIESIEVQLEQEVQTGAPMVRMRVEGEAEESVEAEASEQPTKQEAAEPAPAQKPAPKKAESSVQSFNIPDIGDGGARVIELLVQVGDKVEAEQSLLTLESDKASMEIPAPAAGVIESIEVQLEQQVQTGDLMVRMRVEGDSEATPAPAQEVQDEVAVAPAKEERAPAKADQQATPGPVGAPSRGKKKVHAGPAVRKLAREFGVELTDITGSGPRNRILKEDVQEYVQSVMRKSKESKGAAAATTGGAGIPQVPEVDFSRFGEVELKDMTRLQQIGASNLHRSWLNVPHVTQFDLADISELEDFRKAQKAVAEKAGVKLTVLPFLLKAAAHLLREQPNFNVSLAPNGKQLIQKNYVHIGFAVDTPDGLMVPVIRNVDQKSLLQLAGEAAALAEKARNKKLSADEMQGACFTISSLGHIGGTGFTPIVNAPEVAILGVSKATMQPVWDGSAFQPRLMLPLSLSYDHRAINGAAAAQFTKRLGELLGDIRSMLL